MISHSYDVRRLKAAVSIAAVIDETLPLQRSGQYLVAACPFHNDGTPSFTVYKKDYHCFGCGAHGDVIDWLMATRKMAFADALKQLARATAADHIHHQPHLVPRHPSVGRTTNSFLRCWNEGVDPAGTMVQVYLRNRGGLIIPKGAPIRFHPRCQRGPHNLSGGPEHWPAMLALMTDPITGQPVGLHRTFLQPDGSAKAPVTIRGATVLKPKMIMGTWGVVRLAPDEEIGRALAIAEGIENALTASQTIGWGPVWSAGTQGQIAGFPLLPSIEALTIFADADDSGVGLSAARVCANRWNAAGREALIHVPPEGQDWNDAAQRLPHASA